jgi:RNA ligase (TIGR02306 family)
MADRKLVHIEKIIELIPIPGADRVELAKILGWECVVKKGEFKVGDLCAYFEIDCVLDITKPHFEFLKDTKGRIKTRRFLKQISQGLVLPLSVLNNYGVLENAGGRYYLNF